MADSSPMQRRLSFRGAVLAVIACLRLLRRRNDFIHQTTTPAIASTPKAATSILGQPSRAPSPSSVSSTSASTTSRTRPSRLDRLYQVTPIKRYGTGFKEGLDGAYDSNDEASGPPVRRFMRRTVEAAGGSFDSRDCSSCGHPYNGGNYDAWIFGPEPLLEMPNEGGIRTAMWFI